MKPSLLPAGLGCVVALGLASGCDISEPLTQPNEATPATVARAGESKKLDLALCAPGRGGFTLVGTNPWFPLAVGRQLVLEAEEDGETITMQLTVLDRTRVIEGVVTRVVEEREFVDGELSEVTWNYHVQASDGTICYYGEDVDVYDEDGITHEGAWCPGGDNQAGIFMPADPKPGMKYQNEVAPGIALDEARIVGTGPVTVPFGRFTNTIRIREFNPLTGAEGLQGARLRRRHHRRWHPRADGGEPDHGHSRTAGDHGAAVRLLTPPRRCWSKYARMSAYIAMMFSRRRT